MKFPEDTATVLYYRAVEAHPRISGRMIARGPVRRQLLRSPGSDAAPAQSRVSLADPLESPAELNEQGLGFSLKWNPGQSELRPLLRRSGEADRVRDVCLERVELVLLPGELDSLSLDPRIPVDTRYHIFQHGFQSWSLSGLREHTERDRYSRLAWKHRMDENPETPVQSRWPLRLPFFFARAARGRFFSEHLLGLEALGEPGRDRQQTSRASPARILLFASGHGNQTLRYRVHLDPRSGRLKELAVIWDMNGRRFSRHGRESLTPLQWLIELPGEKSERRTFAGFLNEGMAKLATNFVRRRPRSAGIVGWCSWYYYYTNITEEIILDNLSQLARAKLKVDLFQIDDGWQKAIGDWSDTNSKFPAGMRYLASEIRKAGMRPGIWLAPFLIQKNADLMRTHPDIVLRDEQGQPVRSIFNPNWKGWAQTLDVTHPRFKEWLGDTIRTLVRTWGYTYLKLDFLYAAGFRGRFYDDTTTGASRLRDSLALIRKAAGRDVFLLGCGCPLWPAVGQVDGMRIGMDVNHVWSGDWLSWLIRDRNYPTTRGALINTMNRSFMHNRFWINDPDCLMVRGRDTKLSEKQVYLMASVMALSGGMLLLSDDLTRLEPERLRIFERACELNRKCAPHTPVPLGMLEYHFPRGYYNPAGYLGVWNSTLSPDRIHIPVPAGIDEGDLRRARDYWTGDKIAWQVEDNRIHIALAPFESVVAVWK